MALKLIYGGGATAGAANGTLVSSGNPIVFTALDTAVDCFVRADDDTYSADASFTMPSDGAVQVSFDGGSTWKAFGTNPNSYGVDIGDLNVAIKLRQHANATASTGTFQTDATTPAATALTPNPVSGFTATANGAAQIDLSWTAVTNRTRYQVDRATNSGFTTGVTLGVYTSTSTSFSDTGLTAGTTYYYRIKAVGTGRYSDTASYATANATPTALTARWILVEVDNNYETPGSGLLRFGEIEVDAGSGGTSLLNGKTVTHNTGNFFPGFPLSNITDGNVTTEWAAANSGSGNGQWNVNHQFKIDIGSAVTVARLRFELTNYNLSGPKDFKVFTSTVTSPGTKTYGSTHADWHQAYAGTYPSLTTPVAGPWVSLT